MQILCWQIFIITLFQAVIGIPPQEQLKSVVSAVEVPPAFSETQVESESRSANGHAQEFGIGNTDYENRYRNGNGVQNDGSSGNPQSLPEASGVHGDTHNCRHGRCRPCQGADCTLWFHPEFTVESGNGGSDSGTSQIRIGKVGTRGEPLTGSRAQAYQSNTGTRTYKYRGRSMVSFPCSDGKCSTCIAEKCYPRSYASLRVYVQSHCPPVACDVDCDGFVIHSDNCPICACRGYATREPCLDQSECGPEGLCKNNLCTYPAVAIQTQCQYSYQCKSKEVCQSDRCAPDHSGMTHIEGRNCAYDYHCPANCFCRSSTCWIDPRYHTSQQGNAVASLGESGRPCAFHYQCPSSYICLNTKCIDGGIPHGTSPCAHDTQCKAAEYCIDKTCIPARNVIRIHQSSDMYRCQYQRC